MTEFRLLLPRLLFEEMLAHAQAELPNECVGVFGGVIEQGAEGACARVNKRYPLINELSSPTRFHSSKSLGAINRDMRQLGIDFLAIYHSHPTSEPIPSRTDLEQNNWPSLIHLIVSLTQETPSVRGWWLTNTDFREATWEVTDEM